MATVTRFGSAFTLLLVILIAIEPTAGSAQNTPREAPAATVGARAAPFRLTTLEGAPIALEDFRGTPLVINFFASWCDPCREEMPLLNALARGAREGGYALLGIAIEDRHAALVQFANMVKLAFPVALDTTSRVKRSYRIFGPPATFFVDGGGTIRDIVVGPITAERAQLALRNAVGRR
jgi:cytochrome c biogenesis protein CcmG, thiol:disulfide interchange protein DsbE